jgi:hypothetical protein
MTMTHSHSARAKQAWDELSADPDTRQLGRNREIWRYFCDRVRVHLAEQAGWEQGRAERREAGRAERGEEGRAVLARTIRALCGVLEIELTAAREAFLAEASVSELEQVLDAMEQTKGWPE